MQPRVSYRPPLLQRKTFSAFREKAGETVFSGEREKARTPFCRFLKIRVFGPIFQEQLIMDEREILRMNRMLQVEELSFRLQLEEAVSAQYFILLFLIDLS